MHTYNYVQNTIHWYAYIEDLQKSIIQLFGDISIGRFVPHYNVSRGLPNLRYMSKQPKCQEENGTAFLEILKHNSFLLFFSERQSGNIVDGNSLSWFLCTSKLRFPRTHVIIIISVPEELEEDSLVVFFKSSNTFFYIYQRVYHWILEI